MLRTRRIVIPAFPVPGARICDECTRVKKIKRNHAGRSYCDACYKREFVHVPCAGCGETCIAKRGTVVPYCRKCDVEQRLCKRCGRHVPRAGMYHEGEVVCPSCVPNYKPKEPCPACGEPSSRLSRVGGEGDAICDHCRNDQDHATCGTCGRYRKQAGEEAGRPICVDCVEGTTHTCPVCEQDVPGGGSSRCRDCAARARGRYRVEICSGAIIRPWVRDLFREYCESDLLAVPRGDVVKRVDTAAAFFANLDRSMTEPAAVTSESLLEAYGPEGLRRSSKAVRFVSNALSIIWPTGAIEEFAERQRISAMLSEICESPWASEIATYASALRSETRERPLRSQTVRMYLRAAISLMQHSRKGAVSDLDASDCRDFEKRHDGHRASLSPFYAWASLPPANPSRPPEPARAKALEKDLLARSNLLMGALRTSTSRSQAFALVAALISDLYGKPLRSVLELRRTDISVGRHGSIIRVSGDEIRLDDRLAHALARWAGPSPSDFVFASPRRSAPISTSGVAHHVYRAIGPDLPTFRPSSARRRKAHLAQQGRRTTPAEAP